MKRRAVAFLLALSCAAAAGYAASAERVAFATPVISSDKDGFDVFVGDLVARAGETIDSLYPDSIHTNGSGATADYTVATVASQEKGSLMLVVTLTRTRDGEKSAGLPWVGTTGSELPLWIAHAVFLLWGSFHGYLADQAQEKPVFVDELTGGTIGPTMTPMGVSVMPNGSIIVPLVMGCLEMDHSYRVLAEPGKQLPEKGVYIGGASSTPGGSIVLKPSMGRDLYRIMPGGSEEPQKIPTGLELSSVYAWTALADGGILLVDSINRRAYKVSPGKKRQELPLFASQTSWPSAFATGSDGSIWEYDPLVRGVRIFGSEGSAMDIMLPLVDPTTPIAATSMAVGPDGSLVMLCGQGLFKFERDGRLAWRLDELEGSEQSSIPGSGSIAVDWSRGLIYLSDAASRRIVKLLDRAYCRQKGIRNELEEKVVALRQESDADDAALYAKEARLYDAAGSTLMAKACWQKVAEADPANGEAASRLLAIEVEGLRASARELDAKARSTLSAIGIETARPISVQAIQTYEQLLSKAPDDQLSRTAMNDLKDLFSGAGTGQQKKTPLTLSEPQLAAIFPSLMQWYVAHPPGSITVKNPLSTAVEKVSASLSIPQFMTLPSDSAAIARLGPGESVTLPLTPVFSQKILELQEDMTVQARVTVVWTVSGGEQTAEKTCNVTFHRNTALTWDDTRKVSSFITPNEQTVAGFAARAIAGGAGQNPTRLSRSIFQAMRICDALGAYGITYVPDPDSPISSALGRSEVVDTVRFPRTTLYNRTGDCDDTTTLLCSLLESAGIATAVLTTPGHIFLAFDSGEEPENAAFLETASLQVISQDGRVWIPVESTVLSKGFMEAWASASGLVKRYFGSGSFEFLPLAKMRDAYPALPLPASPLTVAEPSQAAIDRAAASSISGFTGSLYTARLAELDNSLSGLSGKQAVRVRIQEGVLHALFGSLKDAGDVFRKAIAEDPGMTSAYVNLANIQILSGDEAAALQIVKQGLSRNADSALLNLMAARICGDQGNASMMAAYYMKVQKASPELAARFSELSGGSSSVAAGSSSGVAARASQADAGSSLFWSGGE